MKVQRWIPVLVALLAVQLLLGLWLWSAGEEATPARSKLLAFDHKAVDVIEISDGAGRTLWLNKTAEGWRLPGHFDFPAAAFRVDALLDRLAGLRPGLAVATSAEAAGRFRVAKDGFERRIRLLAGDKVLAELYLGDAAGPRYAYGRAAGETAIHQLAFTAPDADTGAGEWTDKTYLHRDTEGLVRVTVGDIRLERQGDAWKPAGLAEGEQSDADAAAALVQHLATLNFMAVAGRKEPPPKGKPLLDAQLVYQDGRQVDFRFIDPGQGGDPLLLVSDRDHVLRIGSYAVKPLLEAGREALREGS